MARLLVLLLFCGLWQPAVAYADDPLNDPLAELASGAFNGVRQGVEDLALSGNPRAATILSALQGGQLCFTPGHTLLIKGADDHYVDAATGAPVADAGFGVKPVRLNNSVRGAIDAALGSLRLFDPSASVRLEAAEAVFQSHDPAAIPALDRALAKGTDASVRRRMEQARGAAILYDRERHPGARQAGGGVVRGG